MITSQIMNVYIITIQDQRQIYTLIIKEQIIENSLLNTEEHNYGIVYQIIKEIKNLIALLKT